MKKIYSAITLLLFCLFIGCVDQDPEMPTQLFEPKKGTEPEIAISETFTVNKVSFNMIYVEGGTFTMGATAEQGTDANNYEKPTHSVTLNNYRICETEVTQALWQAVMGNNPSYHTGDLQRPVEQVNWDDCQEFVKKLNSLTGKNFRLPTEAEWEYAARGGIKSKGYKYAGSNTLDDVAWHRDNSNNVTHKVAEKQPNELGLYDMSGNVYEWCYDWYGNYSSKEQTNPYGLDNGSQRVVRSGSYASEATHCRITDRDGDTPDKRYLVCGFRLVLPINETKTFTVNNVSFDMIFVEGGTFTMGATAEQGSDANDNEKPAHSVTLNGYYIGKTEVTQALWQAVMGYNPSKNSDNSQYPVEQVSWYDCQEFIKKLSQLTKCNFGLPTEAEWEYAARGGIKSKGYKYAGSDTLDNVGWYIGNSAASIHPVASKEPNELGLYDMSGNVYEWCYDWYGSYNSNEQTNPKGASDGTLRVARGGSYADDAEGCRVANRGHGTPEKRYLISGLRLSLYSGEWQEPDPTTQENVETITVNGVSFNMITVDGGTFTMGATNEQGNDYDNDEKPTHNVTLTSYQIGQTEVTQALWQAVMGNNPSHYTGNLQQPVESVSWNDCQEFIEKLKQLTGKKFRLPTEAEWEFAARGGTKSKGYKYSGSNILDNVAWYKDNSNIKPHSVATKLPNELGIYDMSGNAYEWCYDWYGSYSSNEQTNPAGLSTGNKRVIRDGAFIGETLTCRISHRTWAIPDTILNTLGLRLVISDIDPKDQIIEETIVVPSEYETFTINGVSFNMILVDGGTFTMGATSDQGNDYDDNELPTHRVTLTSYHIGQTEVTQALWQAVMGNNPSKNKGDSQYPVEQVSWNDCQVFITKLNQLTGRKFRLPTEAEWEYAARGGNISKHYKYAGSNTADDIAWAKENSNGYHHIVATKKPNELGIYDMSGNVWEWCYDWYGSYSGDLQTNPQGAPDGTKRVLRGSGYINYYDYEEGGFHLSYRNYTEPETVANAVGFRLVLSPIEMETFTVNGVSFNMITVDGGTFTMGATPEQGSDVTDDEKPTHNVSLTSYQIGETEVTQALWQAVMGNNPSDNKGNALPVEQVSWNDCQEFITKLNQLTGRKFRLPTEAEWEFAARGGNKSKHYKYAGSNNLDDVAWYSNNNMEHIVSTKMPNELGIYDMSGNVCEWCYDWIIEYSDLAQTDPVGTDTHSSHVVRGGAIYQDAKYCRLTYRLYGSSTEIVDNLGFRLVISEIELSTEPDEGTTTAPEQSAMITPEQGATIIPEQDATIKELETFTINGVTFNMVAVEGGTFTMGATEEQGNDAKDNEKPAHKVTLSNYYIGETEVTQSLWKAIMDENPSLFKDNLQYPVEGVTYESCQEFIEKLNQFTNKNFRLPTEAEWEYAARGGNKSKGYKFSGSNDLNYVAWNFYNSNGTNIVATKMPNELGIYDMSGNVWELCNDYLAGYSSNSSINPTGATSGYDRVLRGGSYNNDPMNCRISRRVSNNRDWKYNRYGLRLAYSDSNVTNI